MPMYERSEIEPREIKCKDISNRYLINTEDFLPAVINISLQKRLMFSEFKLRREFLPTIIEDKIAKLIEFAWKKGTDLL